MKRAPQLALAAFGLLIVAIGWARAEPLPGVLATTMPDALFRGTATARWLGIPLYDAALWVDPAMRPDSLDYSLPFVLRLRYARSFSGETIANTSRDEIARMRVVSAEQLTEWHARMRDTFPDVSAGTEIAGMNVPGVGVSFFRDGVFLADLPGGEFARAFFGIWFDPLARDATLRQKLLSASDGRR